MHIELIPRLDQPELWIECDVPGAEVWLNGRISEVAPVRLHGSSCADCTTRLLGLGEGIEARLKDGFTLKIESRVPSPLAEKYDCYKRDGQWWLKLDQPKLTIEPGDKVTLHLRAKPK